MGHGEDSPPPSLRFTHYEYVHAHSGYHLANYLNNGWELVHGPFATANDIQAILRREKRNV